MLPFGEGLHEEIEVDESAGIYGDGTSWADDTAFSLSGPCPERLLQKASSLSALVKRPEIVIQESLKPC